MDTNDQEREVLRVAGRRFAALRRIVRKSCRICGREMSGTVRRLYCSNACRVRASRQSSRLDKDQLPSADVPQEVAPVSSVLAAVERARAFQRRVFGDRVLAVPTAELIEEERRRRSDELP